MEKRKLMIIKMEEYKSSNPGIEIDEETFLEDLEEYPNLPDIYIPEVPNQVQSINYTKFGNIWMTLGGFDAGYVYEYNISSQNQNPEVLKFTKIQNGGDLELQSYLIHNNYIFLGMEHGELRICRINSDDFTDFSDYLSFRIHDYYRGRIRKIILSKDEEYLFTCGDDGNVFSFFMNFGEEKNFLFEVKEKLGFFGYDFEDVEDIKDFGHPSLEEVIVGNENERILSLTRKSKEDMYHLLRNLTKDYQAIMERNRKLIKSQQISASDFVLDERISEDLNRQLGREMELIGERMAFKIEKNKLILGKLMDHFVRPITCLPFGVSRIS